MLKTILKAIADEGVTLKLSTNMGGAVLTVDRDDDGTVHAKLKVIPAAQPARTAVDQ
ncbi:hypothetical protein SEA_PAOLA_68 [Mycobacterium phage Paola]|uniref:Uncharacterized protein n=2 Tax=Kratiovirus TaxID=2948788 RepID=A0A2R4APT5_9CAUD|nr:hypothetical protein I5G73_gp31 [Mycobacterium phage Leston]YP_009950874.1 hypothetical protein I5G74_gp29 [Mycobacterium phage Paola]ASR85856.1 hypothetical protein SEA_GUILLSMINGER_69 [Mycobacterium phage Guillsminger]AVO25855.1 hypothetical protein SEA_PAOLA_68 [Mycobacterium phage Paola]AVR77060.1 hypothetical protein SEA_LESTON_68 [Mycobacterium phage Leston]